MKGYRSVLFVIACLLIAVTGHAQVPQLLNYQGRLVDGATLVDGDIGLTLRLYNAETGGTQELEDSNTVTVIDGLYKTYIGDDIISGSLAAALTNAEVWVEVEVNGTPLTPRERIVAVAYALAITESDPTWVAASNDIQTQIAANYALITNRVVKTGDTMTGPLFVQSSLTVGDNTATGTYAVAIGTHNDANGAYSHAEGYYNIAEGAGSHAEGAGTIASGMYAHAEGHETIAGGYGSHAEGDRSRAFGAGSHAEGGRSMATGLYSHASGYRAQALHDSTYVWADSQNADFPSIASDEFAIRASAGLRLANGPFIGDGAGITNLPAGSYTETDPVWSAEKSDYATGTPLYVYTETDPVWLAEKSGYATGTPLYAYTETDPVWIAASNAIQTQITGNDIDIAALQDLVTNKVSKTGDEMTGPLVMNIGANNEIIITNSGSNISIGNNANGQNLGTAIGYRANANDRGSAVGRDANAAALGIALGASANGYDSAVAIGFIANASPRGVAIGRDAIAQVDGSAVGYAAAAGGSGAALGRDANGETYGAALGRDAHGRNYGAAVGYGANGWDSGVAVGEAAYGARGAAIGRDANGGNQGVAVGREANGSGGDIAIGHQAFATGVYRTAIGYQITNGVDNSAALRGTVYLDGGTGIYYRSTFGSGAWNNLMDDAGDFKADGSVAMTGDLDMGGHSITNVDTNTIVFTDGSHAVRSAGDTIDDLTVTGTVTAASFSGNGSALQNTKPVFMHVDMNDNSDQRQTEMYFGQNAAENVWYCDRAILPMWHATGMGTNYPEGAALKWYTMGDDNWANVYEDGVYEVDTILKLRHDGFSIEGAFVIRTKVSGTTQLEQYYKIPYQESPAGSADIPYTGTCSYVTRWVGNVSSGQTIGVTVDSQIIDNIRIDHGSSIMFRKVW